MDPYRTCFLGREATYNRQAFAVRHPAALASAGIGLALFLSR